MSKPTDSNLRRAFVFLFCASLVACQAAFGDFKTGEVGGSTSSSVGGDSNLGGLGMGYSLRAALDHLPPSAQVVVAELNRKVVDWNHDVLASLARSPLGDGRVKVVVADVAKVIAEARPHAFDAIIFDLYEGPHGNRDRHPLYGNEALVRTHAALTDGGIFSVWSEESDAPFEERLKKQGFSIERHSSGKGGRVHLVYLARAEPLPPARERPARPDPAGRRVRGSSSRR